MSKVIALLGEDRPDPAKLEQLGRILTTFRSIQPNDFRDQRMLLMRQIKSTYLSQYGFDAAINRCASLEQLQALIPVDIYNVLLRLIEIKKQIHR